MSLTVFIDLLWYYCSWLVRLCKCLLKQLACPALQVFVEEEFVKGEFVGEVVVEEEEVFVAFFRCFPSRYSLVPLLPPLLYCFTY
jgi:hypothetical protein